MRAVLLMRMRKRRMTSNRTILARVAHRGRAARHQSLSMRRKRKKRTSMRMRKVKMEKRKMRSFKRSGESMSSQRLISPSASRRSYVL